MKAHHYTIDLKWTGNEGKGTKNYKTYNRSHSINAAGKYSEILGSSDPLFNGDKTKYNPEDMFLSSIASCHMLWYLHLCSVNHIIVTSYTDKATGVMEESHDGSGQFKEVTLHPEIVIEDENQINRAMELHTDANKMCFIANSCNFKIGHKAKITSSIN